MNEVEKTLGPLLELLKDTDLSLVLELIKKDSGFVEGLCRRSIEKLGRPICSPISSELRDTLKEIGETWLEVLYGWCQEHYPDSIGEMERGQDRAVLSRPAQTVYRYIRMASVLAGTRPPGVMHSISLNGTEIVWLLEMAGVKFADTIWDKSQRKMVLRNEEASAEVVKPEPKSKLTKAQKNEARRRERDARATVESPTQAKPAFDLRKQAQSNRQPKRKQRRGNG